MFKNEYENAMFKSLFNVDSEDISINDHLLKFSENIKDTDSSINPDDII